ncbi:ATP-binding protein [Kitasatospora terrestris]|uniref:ATP-binding protein n=1 Tax=Kitasatospora terrestris TaxID=258051 RepID=A0ABP9EHB4_9ACTN
MRHDEARPPSPDTAARQEQAPGAVRTAGQARAVVAQLLGGDVHPDGRVLADVQLVVTELVANALRHGGGLTAFAARLEPGGARLVVDVEDGDDRHPVAQPFHGRDPASGGGRGWAIVQALTSTCQVQPLPVGGKRIRVTFVLPPASAGFGPESAG